MKIESSDWTNWDNMPAIGETVDIGPPGREKPMLVTARGLGWIQASEVKS